MVLGAGEAHVLFFRVSFELGQAIDQHRQLLVHALAGEDLFGFLLECSKKWLDIHVRTLSSFDYDRHVQLVHMQIDSERALASPRLAAACGTVRDAITVKLPEELELELQRESDGAFLLAERVITRFGGQGAWQLWATRQRAQLRILHREELTMCTFERGATVGTDSIVLHLGSHLEAAVDPKKAALHTYFCTRFYFFHEYVSHSFPAWQTTEFVDGYLVWAERYMFLIETRDHLRDRFVRVAFDSFERSHLAHTNSVADWFSAIAPADHFLRFLVDWASLPDDDCNEAALAALHTLADRLTERDSDGLDGLFVDGDAASIRRRICNLALQTDGFPPPYTPRLV